MPEELQTEDKPAARGIEICVPKSALNEGESEEVTPGDGESVTGSVTGKIRYDGDNAYIAIETFNGEPLTMPGEPKAEEPDSDDDIRKMGTEADEGGGY